MRRIEIKIFFSHPEREKSLTPRGFEPEKNKNYFDASRRIRTGNIKKNKMLLPGFEWGITQIIIYGYILYLIA